MNDTRIPESYLRPAQIVGIVYWGRSGTILLHSMLDSHPDVLSCNAFFWHYSHEMDVFIARSGDKTRIALLEFVCEKFNYLFEHKPAFFPEMFRGKNCDLSFGTDQNRFRIFFNEYLACFDDKVPFQQLPDGHTFHTFVFQAIHVAYAMAQGQTLESDRPTIVWQTHFWQPDYFRQRFPTLRILAAVRNPLTGYDSWQQRGYVDERVPPFWYYHAVKFRQMIEHTKVPPDLLERSRVIRFEDIHNRTECVMRSLAEWLGIRWNEKLLESTIDGEPYWGVKGGCSHYLKSHTIPPREALVTGTREFDETKINLRYLGTLDRWRLAVFCDGAIQSWGYDGVRIKSAILRKMLSQWKPVLFVLPSKLDRLAFFEDLRLTLQEQRAVFSLGSLKAIVAAFGSLVRNKIKFYQEMNEIFEQQRDWRCIEPVFLPMNKQDDQTLPLDESPRDVTDKYEVHSRQARLVA